MIGQVTGVTKYATHYEIVVRSGGRINVVGLPLTAKVPPEGSEVALTFEPFLPGDAVGKYLVTTSTLFDASGGHRVVWLKLANNVPASDPISKVAVPIAELPPNLQNHKLYVLRLISKAEAEKKNNAKFDKGQPKKDPEPDVDLDPVKDVEAQVATL